MQLGILYFIWQTYQGPKDTVGHIFSPQFPFSFSLHGMKVCGQALQSDEFLLTLPFPFEIQYFKDVLIYKLGLYWK